MRAYSIINRFDGITGKLSYQDNLIHIKLHLPRDLADDMIAYFIEGFKANNFQVRHLYENSNMRMDSTGALNSQINRTRKTKTGLRRVEFIDKMKKEALDRRNELKNKVLEILKDEPNYCSGIARRTGIHASTLNPILKELFEEKKIQEHNKIANLIFYKIKEVAND